MVRKSKSESSSTRRPPMSHASSAGAGTPSQRLAMLLQDAEARGVRPVDKAALEAMGGAWPEEENLEIFLAWLYESRRTGRYV